MRPIVFAEKVNQVLDEIIEKRFPAEALQTGCYKKSSLTGTSFGWWKKYHK